MPATTTGTVLSKIVKMYSGATAYTCQVNLTLGGSTNMFETTCKDSGANSAFLPGSKSWTATMTGNLAFDATLGFSTPSTGIFALWDSQGVISMVVGTGLTGDSQWAGEVYVSNWSLDASGNDNATTWSVDLQGTDDLAMSITT